jgi:hypothetical protein
MAPSAAPEALPFLIPSQFPSKSTITASVLHGPTDLRLVTTYPSSHPENKRKNHNLQEFKTDNLKRNQEPLKTPQ